MSPLKKFLTLFVLMLFFAVGMSAVSVSQDNSGDVTCDSDLILLNYVAERYFGFSTVEAALPQQLDLSRFNRGQFTPLFDALQSAQAANATLSQEQIATIAATIQMDDAAFQDFLGSIPSVSPVTPLVPGNVAGEAVECAQLRAQLQRFFAAVAVLDAQAGFSLNANVNLNANDNNVNANANNNANDNTNVNANENANVNANENANANDNTNANDNNNGNSGGGNNSGSGNSGSGGSGNSGSGGGDNSGSGNSGSSGGDNSGSGNSGSGGGNSGSGGGGN